MIRGTYITVLFLFWSLSLFGKFCGAPGDSVAARPATRWSVHFQATAIGQWHGNFPSPYQGRASLKDTSELATTISSTLFLGFRIWKYGALYLNPEIAGGEGLSGGNGIAGFPNGEVERVVSPAPVPYIARAYYQQSVALPGAVDGAVADDFNQVSQILPDRRITITAGHFSVEDLFDLNPYAHDPRSQFMNWALMADAAWDFPANTRGYTTGIGIQIIEPCWHISLCGAQEPTVANGPNLDTHIDKTFGLTCEAGFQYRSGGRSGGLSLLLYLNQDRGGSYAGALSEFEAGNPYALLHLDSLTAYAGNKKFGAGLNWNQPLGKYAGFFLRAGWNNGENATWAFTPVDQTISCGIELNGKKWNREQDQCGIAVVGNGISPDHINYLQAGGYDFMIGDGKLPHYANEIILETFYNIAFYKNLFFSPDFQFVMNPGYNADRGPVPILGARVHAQF